MIFSLHMQCFDITAKEYIHKCIKGQYNDSLDRFTVVLKLRLLLKPMRYDGDCKVIHSQTLPERTRTSIA